MDKETRKTLLKTLYHMKSRCYDKNDKRYKDWGGRNIKICEDWLNNSESFLL